MTDATQQTRAIATRSTDLKFTITEEMSLTSVADVFLKSGLFSDVKSQAVAMTKILAGREMGMEPVESMMSLTVIQGRVGVCAEALAAKIKAEPNMRYKVLEHTDEICSIMFYERIDGAWDECGPPSIFTAADAKRAGTQNMNKFPKNMVFARALSNGFKWYAPHLKVPGVLTPEEIETIPADNTPSTGAKALDEALEVFDTPKQPKAVEPAIEPQEGPQEAAQSVGPTLEVYRGLCGLYKATLGEEDYHQVLQRFTEDESGKSNAVTTNRWDEALGSLHANTKQATLAPKEWPSMDALAEAVEMKRDDLIEGVTTLEQDDLGQREAYLGKPIEKALVSELRVYHAALQDGAWGELAKQAKDLFGEEE